MVTHMMSNCVSTRGRVVGSLTFCNTRTTARLAEVKLFDLVTRVLLTKPCVKRGFLGVISHPFRMVGRLFVSSNWARNAAEDTVYIPEHTHVAVADEFLGNDFP